MTNTTLCYIEKDGKYLMLHRVKKINDLNKDKWIGIGGKLENCESPQDCIRREVKEESGLELGKIEYRGFVTFVDMSQEDNPYTEYMHLFWTDDFKGQLKVCDEGDLEWVLKSKMNDLPHWKGDEIFLDLIDKKAPFFSLKLVYKNGVLLESILN
ncbi:MAG: 8-oxo-dGTP diphosphatase [Treponema sp.]|nr:8-oxo-dGTP diphosphatase [Treponema sp.]